MKIMRQHKVAFIVFVTVLLIAASAIVFQVNAPDNPEASATTAPSTEPTTVPPTEPVYEEIDIPLTTLPATDSLKTIYDVENLIAECKDAITECETLLSTTPLEHPQYNDISEHKTTLSNAIEEYTSLLDAHWEEREKKRPIMTYVWKDLKAHGWSDAVVSGIIGNCIAECGGMGYQDLDWDVCGYGSSGRVYYGICQWALVYVPNLKVGSSVDEQLDHLKSSIKREMNTLFSKSYRNKFGVLDIRYDDFVQMEDPYEAAIAFAVCYEKCAAKHVERRGPLAEKTYDYYINLGSWPWPGKK